MSTRRLISRWAFAWLSSLCIVLTASIIPGTMLQNTSWTSKENELRAKIVAVALVLITSRPFLHTIMLSSYNDSASSDLAKSPWAHFLVEDGTRLHSPCQWWRNLSVIQRVVATLGYELIEQLSPFYYAQACHWCAADMPHHENTIKENF